MKISPITLSQSVNQIQYRKTNRSNKDVYQSSSAVSGLYYKPLSSVNSPKTISFMGKTVHIVDGGIHADNMQHFLKAVRNSVDIQMHEAAINPADKYTKQLKSVEEQLRLLNENIKPNSNDVYVAIPVLASVPLLNIQDQYRRVMKDDTEFTPENIKANKEKLIMFLKILHDYPEVFAELISYMDPIAQGIGSAYGVIQQINELVKKHVNVYVPSGHPNDATIKWMAKERGVKPELYHYIATGEDVGGIVGAMKQEIKDKNWYNFNLLSLSDARVVGLKSSDWVTDYIFSAYDSCTNDSGRGVYNLAPLRDGEKIIGYSYTEDNVNDYPYDEFPMNKEVANLAAFVGKDKEDVVATQKETLLFLQSLRGEVPSEEVPDKLYRVQDVFYSWDLEKNKIMLQGTLVNKDLNLFFDTNKDGKIIFPKCDCEGSGRPGVMPIWGSCYAMLNVIARDIGWSESNRGAHDDYKKFLDLARYTMNRRDKRELNMHYAAVQLECANKSLRKLLSEDVVIPAASEASELLSAIYSEKGDYENAAACLNTAIDVAAKSLVTRFKIENLPIIRYNNNQYFRTQYKSDFYKKYLAMYDNVVPLSDWIKREARPAGNEGQELSLYSLRISLMYAKLAELCAKKGESYPARVCEAAAKDLLECNARGIALIKRRADGVQYIGDLYNEIKPD